MDIQAFLDSQLFSWVVLPLLIFVSKICDVTLGTVRIIFVSRGKKLLAPLLGFFETLIWLVAISQIMQHLNNIMCYIAYAAGFAAGNLVGIIIEEKIAVGTLVVRVIMTKDERALKDKLISSGYGVTVVDAKGASGDVKVVYTIIKRKDLDDVTNIIHACSKKAFYSVEEAKAVSEGVFPSRKPAGLIGLLVHAKMGRVSGTGRKRK